jgi:hypothetical protein
LERWEEAAPSASLNIDTVCTRPRACSSRLSAAAAASSTSAAFCCVTSSIWPTAWVVCSMPELCSFEADAISVTSPATCWKLATTSSIVVPASCTSLAPDSTLSTDSAIRVLISLAAVALRCARLRTSLATTAKPRPCSPARAASTAAFSARMLVWKAIESITPMMSEIFFELAWISPMVTTTSFTTWPPLTTPAFEVLARSLAWRAFSAFWRTVALSSSMAEEVSSRLEACSSVRLERSALPAAISCEAMLMASVASLMRPTTSRRRSMVVLVSSFSWPKMPE